ncbi:hypothetical protein ACOYR1_11290 [Thalassotalea piscium]
MEPHGKIALQWNKNLLVVKTYGAFNIEGVKLAFEQIQQSVKASGFTSWYRVDILDNETLGSKEVMEFIGNSYVWSCNEAQCHSVAVCCANLLQQEMMKKFIERTSLNIKVFNSIEQTHVYIAQTLSD